MFMSGMTTQQEQLRWRQARITPGNSKTLNYKYKSDNYERIDGTVAGP